MRAGGMRVARVALAALIGAVAGTGCRNACEQVCVNMAAYAKEDCSLPVTDGELDACIERQSGDLDKEDLAACRDFGSPEVLRTQWTCDDLSEYWAGGGGAR